MLTSLTVPESETDVFSAMFVLSKENKTHVFTECWSGAFASRTVHFV